MAAVITGSRPTSMLQLSVHFHSMYRRWAIIALSSSSQAHFTWTVMSFLKLLMVVMSLSFNFVSENTIRLRSTSVMLTVNLWKSGHLCYTVHKIRWPDNYSPGSSHVYISAFINYSIAVDNSLYYEWLPVWYCGAADIGGATPKFSGGPNLRPTTDVIQATEPTSYV